MAGLQHALALNKDLDQRARERFTSSMRAWVLTDLAGQMQADYATASELVGITHDTGEAVHQFLKDRGLFKWYSSLRCATQELVWQSVLRAIENDPTSMADIHCESPALHGGSLTLDPAISLPDYAGMMDVHLMPGSYQGTRVRAPRLVWCMTMGWMSFRSALWVRIWMTSAIPWQISHD